MAYTEIDLSLIKSGKELLYTLFATVKANFTSHETRLTEIEGQNKRIPVGIVLRRGSSEVPIGYLLCDGTSYVRADYQDLFDVMGLGFTLSDDGVNFNVPDLRGRNPVGVGPGYPMGDTFGFETHTLTSGELPTHPHTVTDPGHTHTPLASVTNGGGAISGICDTPLNTGTPQTGTPVRIANIGGTVGNTGGGGSHNNVMPSLVCAFMVKT